MAVDLFLVLPSSPTVKLAADPTQDQYFKSTYGTTPVVEIGRFSFGTENPLLIGSATSGAGAGKLKFKELVVERAIDTLSSSLFTVNATGGHLSWMQIALRKSSSSATAPPRPHLVFGFEAVFITGIDWSAGDGDDVALEQVTFAYGGLAIGYYPQRSDGTFGTLVKGTWNQTTNTPTVAQEVWQGFPPTAV